MSFVGSEGSWCVGVAAGLGAGSCDSLNLALPSLARLGSTAPRLRRPWHARRRRRSLQLPAPSPASCRTPRVLPATRVGNRHRPHLSRRRPVLYEWLNARWVGRLLQRNRVARESVERLSNGDRRNRNLSSSKWFGRVAAARRASSVRSGPGMALATNRRSEASQGWRAEVKRDGPPPRVAPYPGGSNP